MKGKKAKANLSARIEAYEKAKKDLNNSKLNSTYNKPGSQKK